MKIERPIFFVGVPRSGTTVLFEALAVHQDLAWFCNYSATFPRLTFLRVLPRIYSPDWLQGLLRGAERRGQQGLSWFNRFLPRPAEAYALWARLCGERFRSDYLIDVKASPEERRRVYRAVRWTLRLHGKSRFATKTTGPVRIGYLDSVFPDAIFVHVIRDGRAVVNSLLNVGFWKERGGYERPWWKNGLPDGWEMEWQRFGRSPLALAAIQWRTIIEVAQQEKAKLDSERYIEVKYEDFIDDPAGTIGRVVTWCGLKASPRVPENIAKARRYKSMNYKYMQRFSKEEVDALHQIMGNRLEQLGYACTVPV